jgi:hypothetical protein
MYSSFMNNFIKGMGKLSLFPPPRKNGEKTANTAWYEVGEAFWAVGNSIRAVMYEQAQTTRTAGYTPK